MNVLKNSFLPLVFLSTSFFSQVRTAETTGAILRPSLTNTTEQTPSNILSSHMSDTVFAKVELKNALYDIDKNNYPYYIISKKTAYNQTAAPNIIIKKTQLVTDNHAAVIKKYFSRFLGKSFNTTELASLSRGENLNQYKLYPFRINELNQLEELIDYDINWQVSANANRAQSAATFTTTSVLASGTWYKIGITTSGIHKIDKSFLNNNGITGVDPSKIRVYGNGGSALPEMNSDFRYDDLQQNAIKFVGNGDATFDDNEYFLFYASNTDRWKRITGAGLKYSVLKNLYSDTAFYFLNFDLGAGKRITTQLQSVSPPNVSTTSYDYYNYHEVNAVNFMKSGRQFFGESFDVTTAYNFNFNEGNFATDTIICEATMAGRGASATGFNVNGNGMNFNVTTAVVDVNNYLADYASVSTGTVKVINTSSGAISVFISKLTSSSIGWLDKLTINARRNLVADRQFVFRDSRISGAGNVCHFTLSQANSPIQIWNVSDIINPFIQSYTQSGSVIDFTAATDSLMQFAVAPDNDYYKPVYVGKVANQNLHALQQADYVIVTHPLFAAHAQRLANLHEQHEGLTYAIATTDQIYNEFSSGAMDVSAIRDFTRMLYTRNIIPGKMPRYVLLFGDGSYDNKNHDLVSNSCLIPTYESPLSLSATGSTASDDFFALMDPAEGATAESYGNVDIGMGRLTCRTVDEASAVVNKIENYYKKDDNFKIADDNIENCTTATESTFGDWKNWLIFLADDEDYALHMHDANQIATMVQGLSPVFNQDKMFLDAYQQFSTPGGQRYPDVELDLAKRIKKGALVFNYTGHGGEVGLTAERIVSVETINAWDNFNRLPLFVTATCEFTRYDDPGRTSAGELCLLNPKGGAISLFTTCRLAFSTFNLTLNTTLFNFMFKKLPNGKKPCLGDMVRNTKGSLNQYIYYANFHLIGDPAITLSYPDQRVNTSKINLSNITPTTTANDTIGALQKVTISGFVSDTLGNKLTNFNGLVYPTVFDKEKTVACLLNDPDLSYYVTIGTPFTFKLQKNILYRGKVEVKNGDFTFTFIVPKDISFAYGPGRISYYATDGNVEAAGYYQKVIVGGGSKNVVLDDVGPQVHMYLNNKDFVNGGITNEKPVLYANLTDSSGINTLGSSIGHDITAVLDGNISKPTILNDYYEANLNSYQSGRIRYPFDQLPDGNHNLAFKVWDIQNNSNLVNIDFVVAASAELALKHVLNYPNPFTTATKFFIEHNQACNPLKVTVQVYTISGKLVKTILKNITCEGFRAEGIDWDGKDEFGDKLGRGVYIYKVAIINSDNKKAEKTEKLVILN